MTAKPTTAARYTVRVHEPGRDAQLWRCCTHRVDADSWFVLAASLFPPDTEIALLDSDRVQARVTVLTRFVAAQRLVDAIREGDANG